MVQNRCVVKTSFLLDELANSVGMDGLAKKSTFSTRHATVFIEDVEKARKALGRRTVVPMNEKER